MKSKLCNICKTGKRLSNKTYCYQCFLVKERAKRELNMEKMRERKAKKVERDHNSYRYLNKLAWKLMSLAVRQKGADENGFNLCYTCGKRLPIAGLQAGHFWHGKLDYDFRNLRPQCPACNKWKSGNLAVYSVKLIKELGWPEFEKLDYEAHNKIYSRQDLKKIITDLQMYAKRD